MQKSLLALHTASSLMGRLFVAVGVISDKMAKYKVGQFVGYDGSLGCLRYSGPIVVKEIIPKGTERPDCWGDTYITQCDVYVCEQEGHTFEMTEGHMLPK